MAKEPTNGAGSAEAPKSFIAMRHPAARMYLIGAALAMMADNIEHVISYWILYEKFQSPMLQGFAVFSHWVPFLLFSFWAGGLADRYDPRKLIQIGMVLFMLVSLGWGILFWLDIMEEWHAVVLLSVHGFAGVLWSPAAQLFIHSIVGGEQLQSAIRTMASSRTLGILFGPAVGGVMMIAFGPAVGILLNVLFYLPLAIWLFYAPENAESEERPARRGLGSFAEVMQTIRDLTGNHVVLTMTLLAGVTSLIVGNAFQAQMPKFALDFGHKDGTVLYSMLLAANAAGALTAGIVLESGGFLRARVRTSFILAALWCASLGGFAIAGNYWIALLLLMAAGFLNLAFSSMARTLAQLNAPANIRGRAIGLFNVSDLGLRSFSGMIMGGGGVLIGIHSTLAATCMILLAVIGIIYARMPGARDNAAAE